MEKKVLILKGSPRKAGNTNSLVAVIEKELEAKGIGYESLDLYDLNINPCIACRECQKDWTAFNCFKDDDMNMVVEKVMESQLILLASPIYSWYCTPPMKIALDRMVYGLNKYYGDEKGPSIWAGRHMALVTTCGYKVEKGADLWEEGMKRYCRHSGLTYKGMLAERHLGYNVEFMDAEKEDRTKSFLSTLIEEMGWA